MKNLNQFVKDENSWRNLFGHRLLDLNTSRGRQEIADIIDGKLSPENLTCDGELSRTEVNRRYRYLTAVAQELKQFDPSVEFFEFG